MIREDWAARPVVCAASGPSLSDEQCALVTAVRARDACRVIAVNNTWQRLPCADILYAADDRWWVQYGKAVTAAGFVGERWTNDDVCAARHRIRHVRSVLGDHLPAAPNVIARGGNSGHQAIALAVKFGARRVVLIGYDMQRTDGRLHHHADHPAPLTNGDPDKWRPRFEPLARDLAATGISVVNATRETALACFPRGDLAELLA